MVIQDILWCICRPIIDKLLVYSLDFTVELDWGWKFISFSLFGWSILSSPDMKEFTTTGSIRNYSDFKNRLSMSFP